MAISTQKGVYRKEGATLDITPSAAIKCGDVKVIGGFNCLALRDIPANTFGTLKILQRGEVVNLTTDEALGETAANTAIYIDANGVITKSADDGQQTPTANKLLGYMRAAVTATALTFEIVCA